MNRRTFHTLAIGTSASLVSSLNAQTTAPRIKIGQIGTRHAHAGGQLASVRQCPDFEVVGVVEPDEAQRKKVENLPDYKGVQWLTEEQLLNTPGLSAVSVETEVGALLDNAERVVKAGLHLHLDKPAGESLEQFKRIIDQATAQKTLIKMGYMFRYNPAFELMIKAVREGWLGEVFSIHAEMSKKLGHDERDPMLRYKGGSMFELGCHLIDSVVRVLGAPEKVTPFIRKSATDGFADNMLAVFDYPNAAVSVRSAMIEVEGGARRQFTVCGTKGTFEIMPLEPAGARLMLDQPQGGYKKGVQSIQFEKLPRYLADWTAFAKAIRGETPWEFNAKHDYTVQKTVLQAAGMLS